MQDSWGKEWWQAGGAQRWRGVVLSSVQQQQQTGEREGSA